MQSYSDFLRSRINHIYTVDEIDVLYRVIEDAAESHIAIDMHKIERFLRPGDLRQIGFGNNAAYDILFEIQGLRWRYDGKVYRALIAPRARRHFPGVEWYVPITVCEDEGTSWSRTHMLRKEYRCRCEEGEEMVSMKSAYKQWQENYVQEAVNKAVGKAVQDTTNDIMERITDNLLKQHPDWTRGEAREHAKALISV